MKKNVFILVSLVITACSPKQHETIAHITQRRLDSGGKLMISYQFHDGDRLISDSMEVQRNRIVPHDSVKVIFSPEDPASSHLRLP